MFLQILNEYVRISNKIAALQFCIVLWIMVHTDESCFFYVDHLVMKHRYDELKLQIFNSNIFLEPAAATCFAYQKTNSQKARRRVVIFPDCSEKAGVFFCSPQCRLTMERILLVLFLSGQIFFMYISIKNIH